MNKQISVRVQFLLFVFVLAFASGLSAQNLSVRDIMAEPSLAGMRADGEKLSPDGTKLIYLWNPEGKLPRDLYLVSTSGGTPTIILRPSELPPPNRPPERENKLNYGLELRDEFARARENQLGNFEWSPDSKKLIFTHGGDIYVMTLEPRSIKRFTYTQGPEFGARFLDNNRILFSQGGNAFVLNTADSTLAQLTREANQQTFISVGNVVPNETGTMVAYTVTDSSKLRQLVVPNFLPEYVSGGGPRRGWSEQKVYITSADGSRDRAHEIKLPKPEGVSNFRRMAWSADGKDLIVDRVDKDTKRRQLFYVNDAGEKTEQVILVTEETDEKWQATLSAIFEPHPTRPGELFFGSERDGYNHLYHAKLQPQALQAGSNSGPRAEAETAYSTNVSVEQLTRGNWQIEWAKWAADDQIVLMSTESGYTEREFYALSIPDKQRTKLPSSGKGMKASPQIDEAKGPNRMLVYERSEWNSPGELYVQSVCFDCVSRPAPVKITNTVPDRFKAMKWSVPKFIEISSRDGKQIPAKIYLPAGHNTSSKTKYPMVIFVHGAGYLQNVINGWNNYYREFMFNDMLTRKGYVVLDIDYRGSAGYGRDWRTDVFDFLGGKDFDDHIDSIDHMVKNYGVDQKRIGAYGGSYGGFMAAMLATRAPERIAAAAALRPVMDWKNYYAANPGYTAQRLGFPDKNPEAYKRSSPITYADKLERPLLILHGMVDDNVHVQDSVQMIEKLIRLGKTQYFEAMLYPSENHAFVRPESWADEYERILIFFDRHLKQS
jgi:dipeptidyl aminopeptidase/acylaminoacyl peptidase